MATLTDRLHGLADDAPRGQASDADALWVRGKRRQRRQRTGGALLVAMLVLAIGSMTTLVVDARNYSVPVADAEATLGLPSAIYDPSPWTPGTDETGPIGPLVAVLGGYRRATWGGQTFSPVGVSASGGYAFLDLAGLADTKGELSGPEGNPLVLSPDGRWIAYYLTGPTSAAPYPGGGDPVVGVALYDTVTGETRRQTFPTEHGLSMDKALTWVGGTLLAKYSQITSFETTPSGGSYSAIDASVLRWDAASGDFDPKADGRFPGFDYQATPAGDRLVVVRKDRVYDLMAPDGSTDRLGRLDVPFAGPVFVNPSRTLVAATEDLDGPSTSGLKPSPIVVADVGGPDAGVSRRLEAQPSSWVVGWRDDRHLIVAESPADASKLQLYLSIDVDTGAREQLLELPNTSIEIQTQIAADALTGPSFKAPEPDFPGDPRRAWGLGGAILVLLGGNLFWRHRAWR